MIYNRAVVQDWFNFRWVKHKDEVSLLLSSQLQGFSVLFLLLLWTVGGSNVVPDNVLHNQVICTEVIM